jgi:hypothetical protein
MQRRDVLRALGAAAALAVLPERDAIAAWAKTASGWRPRNGLTDDQLSLIGAIADTILPRTKSPSATDVKVPAFIDVIVSDQYSDRDRAAFHAGMTSIDTQLSGFTGMAPDARGKALETLEAIQDRRTDPARTYWRLKGLILHGYFTSERVMKDVLHFEMMPGRFEGNARVSAS